MDLHKKVNTPIICFHKDVSVLGKDLVAVRTTHKKRCLSALFAFGGFGPYFGMNSCYSISCRSEPPSLLLGEHALWLFALMCSICNQFECLFAFHINYRHTF